MLGPNREKLRLNLESDLARHARLHSGNLIRLSITLLVLKHPGSSLPGSVLAVFPRTGRVADVKRRYHSVIVKLQLLQVLSLFNLVIAEAQDCAYLGTIMSAKLTIVRLM